MQIANVFPLNDLLQNPDARGESPLCWELHENESFGAMVAGVKATDFTSNFGLGNGEVLGVTLLKNKANLNDIVSAVATLSGTAGKVTVTIESTDAASVENLTLSFLLLGRMIPKDS